MGTVPNGSGPKLRSGRARTIPPATQAWNRSGTVPSGPKTGLEGAVLALFAIVADQLRLGPV